MTPKAIDSRIEKFKILWWKLSTFFSAQRKKSYVFSMIKMNEWMENPCEKKKLSSFFFLAYVCPYLWLLIIINVWWWLWWGFLKIFFPVALYKQTNKTRKQRSRKKIDAFRLVWIFFFSISLIPFFGVCGGCQTEWCECFFSIDSFTFFLSIMVLFGLLDERTNKKKRFVIM